MSGLDPRAKTVPIAWAGLLEEWCVTLAAAGRSRATIATRRDQIARLARGVGVAPADLTAAALIEWAGRQRWAAETRRSMYSGITSFFAWAEDAGRVSVSPARRLPHVRAGIPAPRPAPEDAIRAALQGARAAGDRRAWVAIRLAAELGMRRAEIARVNGRDLSRDLFGATLEIHGKGGRRRIAPLEDDLAAVLRFACQRGAGGFAFPGAEDGHLSARWLGKLAARYLPDAWTLHPLRHRFATVVHEATGDLLAVQQLLGHASVATTQRYVAVPGARLRQAAATAHGAADTALVRPVAQIHPERIQRGA